MPVICGVRWTGCTSTRSTASTSFLVRTTLLQLARQPERCAAYGHVVGSRRGVWKGPVDDALDQLGLWREVIATVPTFLDARNIARTSELIALIPRSCLRCETRETRGLQGFDLPVPTPELAISAMWHPRLDADPGHSWLRQTLVMICRAETSSQMLSR